MASYDKTEVPPTALAGVSSPKFDLLTKNLCYTVLFDATL